MLCVETVLSQGPTFYSRLYICHWIVPFCLLNLVKIDGLHFFLKYACKAQFFKKITFLKKIVIRLSRFMQALNSNFFLPFGPSVVPAVPTG